MAQTAKQKAAAAKLKTDAALALARAKAGAKMDAEEKAKIAAARDVMSATPDNVDATAVSTSKSTGIGLTAAQKKAEAIAKKDEADNTVPFVDPTPDDGSDNTIWNPETGEYEAQPIVISAKPDGSPANPIKPVPADPKNIDHATRDAFELLKLLFRSYDLEELASEIEGYMTAGDTANAALLKLKTNPTGMYAKRFAGNIARSKKGLNAVTEAEYLDLEKSYAQTLKSYGLGNMINADKKENWKKFATYIENDISALEFKDRIDTVKKRVIDADPMTKDMFKKWYPSITDADLVSYFLDPSKEIDKLKAKTTAAEIGSAFSGQKLSADKDVAEGLATYGIDRAGALKGASDIAEVLPVAQKLGEVYGETGIKYDQTTGIDEYLKGSQVAKRKRETLASKERSSFAGNAGLTRGSLSSPNI